MTEEEQQKLDTYNNLVERTKQEYKPRLKNLSKNQLISVIAELATKLSLIEAQAKEQK